MDCDELVQTVLYERGLDPHDCDVHVGFDGGQGILKIGFTSQLLREVTLDRRLEDPNIQRFVFLCLKQNNYGNIAGGCC